jgi:TRAP-type transport system periplasmic protein
MTSNGSSNRAGRRALGGMLIIAFALGLASAAAQAQITVKMATMVPKESSWGTILMEAAAKWKQISGGKVTINFYWGGTQGEDPDFVRKMNLRYLDAAVLTSVGVAEIDKSIYALSVPLMYEDDAEVYAVLDKMRPKLEANMAAKGFVILNWVDGGWLHFFTKKPVATPDDLKKLVLFSWAGDPKSIEIWKSAGFNPLPGPSSELAVGLQTGRFEAFSASSQIAVITGYFQYVKNMTDLNWALVMGATVLRKEIWDKIPGDIKPALMAAQLESAKKLQEDIRKGAVSDVQSMKARGLNVVTVDAKAREQWYATVDKVRPMMRGDLAPVEAYDEALKYRDEYRKQKAGKK